MVKYISMKYNRFPPLLKKTQSSPSNLYFKFNKFSLDIFDTCLAVVGSRRVTQYGKHVVQKIIPEVAASGITIVSGFMYGVDAAAHRAAVSVGGRTIAVMPCGIDIITPAYQKDLYEEILANNGLVISEFDKGFRPRPWSFPKRNRIIAGMCQAVLVVEAAENSGSLITADYAKKYDRKILTIPQNVISTNGLGVLKLLKDGAIPVGSSKDILDALGKSRCSKKSKVHSLDFVESEIVEILTREPMTINEITRESSQSISDLSAKLTGMQLKGLVEEKGGKYYVS